MNTYIFQINRKKEFLLTEAIAEMRRRNGNILVLSQKVQKGNNDRLACGDIVYMWEAGDPKSARHLIARGTVLSVENSHTPVDMPSWQQEYYLNGDASMRGPSFHQSMPRVCVKLEKIIDTDVRVNRSITDDNEILRDNIFLRVKGFYQRTIFSLSGAQAHELDKLAQW